MNKLEELAEEELFGAAKRMARIMGGVFVLNDLGKAKIAELAASLRARSMKEKMG